MDFFVTALPNIPRRVSLKLIENSTVIQGWLRSAGPTELLCSKMLARLAQHFTRDGPTCPFRKFLQ